MLNDATCFKAVYIVCGYTDLRAGMDRLAALVATGGNTDREQAIYPGYTLSFLQEAHTGCRIHLELVLNNGTETIDRFAHIRIAADNVDLFEAGDIT